ncbi:cobalt transporter subunit CbtA [Azospirillum lipoferum]|uniref:Cobalt transporter n=1 Tax=Azospirillum lipoferum TaxID=193 RepID=A0A5A9GT01_AZOLI|nr:MULTISPECIES: CbtA family protein [Azospirillum]KAA0596469.1 cobalt transporter [Azospirillum lipoferum]MCP1610460.1 cobalt transporter subunit CbtA [Azospirillum lipoferum]MDW5538095.1 CbtA family protein [Azospirillum sp. NL1]
MDLIRRLFTAALVAGVLSGTAASVVQQATTVPLILEAEKYEVVTPPAATAAAPAGAPAASHAEGHQHGPVREVGEGVPVTLDEAIQRIGLTIATNLIAGVAYALLLGAAILLAGRPVDARRGLVWGMGGFVAVSLAPSFGLAPELPGMAGAELELRQLWWLSAAAGAGVCMLAFAFARNRLVIAVAVLAAALPHLIGAPHPESAEGAVPAELAARFVTASLGGAALFWAILGSVSGWLMSGLVGEGEPRPALRVQPGTR